MSAIIIWAFTHVITREVSNSHAGKIHLRVVQWGNDVETALLQKIANSYAADYNARQPAGSKAVEVEVIGAPNFDEKVLVTTVGDTPPDVFYVTDDNLSIWADKGILRNLDGMIADDLKKEGPAWLDDYYPQLVNWFKFDGKWEGSGPQYALPCWSTPFCMYVNTELWDKAGLG